MLPSQQSHFSKRPLVQQLRHLVQKQRAFSPVVPNSFLCVFVLGVDEKSRLGLVCLVHVCLEDLDELPDEVVVLLFLFVQSLELCLKLQKVTSIDPLLGSLRLLSLVDERKRRDICLCILEVENLRLQLA